MKKKATKKRAAKKKVAAKAAPKKRATKKRASKKAPAKKTNRGRGRPTSYLPEYADQAYKLCLLGATDKQMADFFRVSKQTINTWKNNIPEFLDSITRGKMVADANVAQRLYARAIGFAHESEKVFQYEGRIVRARTRKQYPPDTQAASLWLRNRQPQIWRDKQDLTLSDPDGNPLSQNVVVYIPDNGRTRNG